MPYKKELEKYNLIQKRFKMDLKFKSHEERLRYYMSVSPKKKLEWLWQMHEFMRSAYTKKQRDIFWRLRGAR